MFTFTCVISFFSPTLYFSVSVSLSLCFCLMPFPFLSSVCVQFVPSNQSSASVQSPTHTSLPQASAQVCKLISDIYLKHTARYAEKKHTFFGKSVQAVSLWCIRLHKSSLLPAYSYNDNAYYICTHILYTQIWKTQLSPLGYFRLQITVSAFFFSNYNVFTPWYT